MNARRSQVASQIHGVQEHDGDLQLDREPGQSTLSQLSRVGEIDAGMNSSRTPYMLFIGPVVWMRLQYYSRFRKLLSYLDGHIDCPIRLSDLAQATCMSPSALSRLFKTRVGITLREFIGAYKLGMAHEMMVTSDLSITEIADALGFVSLSTFERTFRRITGQTPSQYRATLLDGKGMLPRASVAGGIASGKPRVGRSLAG